ncbi:MAG: hypothetical protein WAT78_05775 [Rhizobiaceae bacterium]
MNAIALIVKASVGGGIAYYLYTEQEFSAWLAGLIGAAVFGLAYFMNWDGNSPTSGGGG